MTTELFITAAKEILTGVRKTTPEDLHLFECYIGESMCDSNNWNGNVFTIIGFSWAKPEYHDIAQAIQDEIDSYAKSGLSTWNVEALVVEPLLNDEDLYYTWLADIINSIPPYRVRWETELSEQIEHHAKYQ